MPYFFYKGTHSDSMALTASGLQAAFGEKSHQQEYTIQQGRIKDCTDFFRRETHLRWKPGAGLFSMALNQTGISNSAKEGEKDWLKSECPGGVKVRGMSFVIIMVRV